jgi:tetratricopeptide (TPR) repeat protein
VQGSGREYSVFSLAYPALAADRWPAGQAPVVIPAQLPADSAAFVGRVDQLNRLDELVHVPRQRLAAVVISAIVGTAGVGKTTLAVHWAHRVADRFADGQLYVNLRGFDPAGSVMRPAEAVRGFLDALQVPPQHIPASFQSQVGLYRSLLTGRRVLIVLDNARDANQVRPLLPNSSGSVVVITSRNHLTGLVAAEGAHLLALDLLAGDEARQLLIHRLGEGRVAAEPQAVDEIVVRCGGLPLALAIVAARAWTRPGFSLQMLAGQLRITRSSLEPFGDEDPTMDLRAVFSWSYQAVGIEAARLFRLLSLHPGPDIGAAAAASLAGVSADRVRRLLAELARAHLITEHIPDRFAFHDLLRAYATELAYSHHSEDERQSAFLAVVDHYLHTAHVAALLLNPHRDPIIDTSPVARLTSEHLANHDQALAWFTVEHRVLLAVVQRAANYESARTWQLALTITEFLDRRGNWHDWANTQTIGLEAARRQADRFGQAHSHRSSGRAHLRLGQNAHAREHLRQAVNLFQSLGHPTGQAHTHLDLAWAADTRGLHREALNHAKQALHLYQSADHRPGQANSLNAVGWYLTLLGEHHEAIAHCEQALTLHQNLGYLRGEADTWDSLGHAYHKLGNHRQAVSCYHNALDGFRTLGTRYQEAATLNRLGDTHHAAAEPHPARQAWQHALDILDELRHPDADDVRAKLHSLDLA